MRIGIFSDIHANLEALMAVTAAYDGENIDRYLCAGDVVGYGASPNECVEIVKSMTEAIVLGNHDAAVAGFMDYSFYYEAARRVLDLHASLLTEENMALLRSLPYHRRFPDLDLKLCHGSPINETEFDYIFTVEQAYALLPYYDELDKLTVIGHSHLCRIFSLTREGVEEIGTRRFSIEPDRKYIISVGSVGQPRDYDNRASYTIYDTEEKTFEFKRVAYDIDVAAQKIFDCDLERNFGNRLFLGV
jgi:diadenosine tetraphosphatase ApaH/serine/threonine PP2A family protein phosphatase